MISGARYSGVPHRVHVRPLILFAKPKSVICKMDGVERPWIECGGHGGGGGWREGGGHGGAGVEGGGL